MNEFIFLFDVDGTLTPARKKMEFEFEKYFANWILNNQTYLVTGSDLQKTKEQVSDFILSNCEGVFCCMGNEYWKKNNKMYSNDFKLPTEAETLLNFYVENSKYPKEEMGTIHIERRTGMVNFSVVGRDIDYQQREKYYEWDKINGERKRIVEEFNDSFLINKIQAGIGGKISIDIQKLGFDKSQVLNHIDKKKKTVFFGDKCKFGEIDYPLYEQCDISYEVKDWVECFDLLKKHYD